MSHRIPAGSILYVAEAVVHLPQPAHIKSFADHRDAAPAALELPIHIFGQTFQCVASLGEVHLQGHLPLGIGQAGGGRDPAGLAAHRLEHSHGFGDAHAPVLFVHILNNVAPIPGGAAVARGVVDQSEFGVADVVVDRFGNPRRRQLDAAFGGKP